MSLSGSMFFCEDELSGPCLAKSPVPFSVFEFDQLMSCLAVWFLYLQMSSRKRARTDDILSSSIPAPQSVAIELDVQHPQTLVPMLQSLFKGQLIIMHNLRELAQNRPIIPLEYFLEKVV